MKKQIALLLALALLLCGCGAAEDVGGQYQTNAPDEQTTQAETTETENPLELGRMEGGTYTNAYAGFGCKLDSTWTFMSAEELQELPEQTKDLLEGTELEQYMENAQQITDMFAENVDLLCEMNVLLQKVSLQDRLAFAVMGEDEIIDMMLRDYKDTLVSSYAQAGMQVSEMKRIPVTFLGEEHSALYTLCTLQDVPVYIVQLFDYTRGNYSVTTTFKSYLEDNTKAIMDLFFEV